MQQLDKELDECRALRELGFYAKAARRLRCLLATTSDLRVVADLGEVLMFQGYWQQASQVLDNSCAVGGNDELLSFQVQMQSCFLKPIITGSFGQSLEQAAELHAKFITLRKSLELERPAVLVESYYCKVLQITANFRIAQPPGSIDAAMSRLENLFHHLVQHGRFGEAFTIASDFRRCVTIQIGSNKSLHSSRDCTALLKSLLEWPDLPPVVKAKTLDELADHAEKSGDVTTYHQLEPLAKDLFNELHHAHGAQDILFRQACRNIQQGACDLDQELDLIKGYLKVYEEEEFLHGAQYAVGILLNSVASLAVFELQLGLAQMSQELADESGAKLFWILRYTGILAQWLTRSGRAPRVIEGAGVIYEEIRECDCHWLKGFVAQITAQAYFQTGDSQNALFWSSQCKISWRLCSPQDRADSITMELRSILNLQRPGDEIELIIESADTDIEEEIKDGLIIPAIDQMDWILTQIFIPRRDKRMIPWLERIEALVSQLSGIDADIKRANLYQARANVLLTEAKNNRDSNIENEVIRTLEMAIPLYIKHKRLVEAANTRQMHGLVLYAIFQKSPTPSSLQLAIEMFSIVYDAFRDLDIAVQISSSSYWCSFLAYRGWCHGWIESEYALNRLLSAESARDQERVELSILKGLEALAGKRALGASKSVRDLYNMALHICLQENKPILLWEWLQKAKARSLSDFLGLGVLEPEVLRSAISSDGEMSALFDKEKALLTAIENGDVKERLTRRGELHSIQKQMRGYPALSTLMDLREGSPSKLGDLHSLSESKISDSLCNALVFIDWFFANGNVYMCIVRGQELPFVIKCNITRLSVETWKMNYLNSESGRIQSIINDDLEEDDSDYPLRQLDALVEPLEDQLKDDDLLVCSPTGILHSIPIHALWVDEEPLITRNPVAYCASMTSFIQCWRRAEERAVEGKPQVTMMAVFEPSPDVDFHEQEQNRVYKEIHDLILCPDTTVITGMAGGREALKPAIQSSTIFHFHGHCKLDEAIITNQAIVLADGDFSIRDIFDQKLVAPHITLIACDSASQSVSAGDEPLGIVTALLCAGASSVVGTMWPTSSSTGRNFSAKFYEELKIDVDGSVLNLARALQRAVIKIRGKSRTRHPCHWASFVLHGTCYMKAIY